jgi:LPS-assembly protein
MNRAALTLTAALATTSLSPLAMGQTPAPSNAPVSFTADQLAYDKTGNIVTASGHVRAVQSGQTLYADKIVINRATNVTTASGHVVLTQPSGDTVFADHAVLSQGMKNAVMNGVAARLADSGRMIANGGRRTNGEIDDLSKVVYSACNLCVADPTAAPTWQIRASSATRDLQHKMIEYRNAEMEFYGFPVFYTPYLTQPDPSVKRQTGLLIPAAGVSTRLGTFAEIPYYIVLSPESDVTLFPIIAAKQGPAIRADYRRAFNNGGLSIYASAGKVTASPSQAGKGASSFGDSIFASGQFDLNQDWRAGFDYNHASNPAYLNDFNILPNVSYLQSDVYLEGFSDGAYARLDADEYQGLVVSLSQTTLPIVTPYGQYHFLSDQDSVFGGQLSVDASFFNVLRHVGTGTERLAFQPGYQLPFMLPGGVTGSARLSLITAAYQANHLNQQPNFFSTDSAQTARAIPYGAVMLREPLVRYGAGTQIIEPEVQLVTAPVIGISENSRIPNEDSLDLEFSDANLFSLNRYPGIDRLEGGTRVDYALHASWTLPSGAYLDGILGQSYRFHKDYDYLPASGLTDNVSDIVAATSLAPVPYFNIVYRTRLSHDDLGARMIDATANAGTSLLNIAVGYLYTNTDPYVLYNNASTTGSVTQNPPAGYFTPRHEVTAALATNFDGYSLSGGTQRNLQTGQFDSASFAAGWSNDCFGVTLNYFKRNTSFNLDNGSTTVLLQFTFKTLGSVGFNAL